MYENVLFFLKHKNNVIYFDDSVTVAEGMRFMRENGYTAMPVIDSQGRYAGSISEGDFLWYVTDSWKHQEDEKAALTPISRLIRKNFMPAMRVDVSASQLFDASLNQNYVPIVDDRNIFIGIVTRQTILRHLLARQKMDPNYLDNPLSKELVHDPLRPLISH